MACPVRQLGYVIYVTDNVYVWMYGFIQYQIYNVRTYSFFIFDQFLIFFQAFIRFRIFLQSKKFPMGFKNWKKV